MYKAIIKNAMLKYCNNLFYFLLRFYAMIFCEHYPGFLLYLNYMLSRLVRMGRVLLCTDFKQLSLYTKISLLSKSAIFFWSYWIMTMERFWSMIDIICDCVRQDLENEIQNWSLELAENFNSKMKRGNKVSVYCLRTWQKVKLHYNRSYS